jgi:hypothetical protein
MKPVDKVTSAILIICILVVGVLAALTDIDGEAALGFISGIAISLVAHTTAKTAVNSRAYIDAHEPETDSLDSSKE